MSIATNASSFSAAERRGVYRAVYERRDIRSQFLPEPIPDDVLGRLLDAAHHGPSVGFMQRWDFIVIRDEAIRRAVHDGFVDANRQAARAESLGVGWVSILDLDRLRALVELPSHVVPVAYLCIGYVSEFPLQPELETKGWEHRESLKRLIHFDRWGVQDEQRVSALLAAE